MFASAFPVNVPIPGIGLLLDPGNPALFMGFYQLYTENSLIGEN
jgi:hypothetical protein